MTEEKVVPQIAYAEQSFGENPPSIHCPLCGQLTAGENRPDEKYCEHLVFIHSDLVDDYEYTSENFAARLEAVEAQLEENDEEFSDLDGFEELLAKLGYGKELLVFQVTYGGMASGPLWATDTYAYALGAKATTNNPAG